MNKRRFLALSGSALASGALAATAGPARADHAGSSRTPAMLTISGAIKRTNRGPIDPVADQMFYKQGVRFDRALALDFGTLQNGLETHSIRATVVYDMKKHQLAGPLMTDLLAYAGATLRDNTHVKLRALDGYTVAPTIGELRRYGYIAATHLDDVPLAIGGLGPLFVMVDVDRFPDLLAKTVEGRYTLCSWGLCHIEVMAAQA